VLADTRDSEAGEPALASLRTRYEQPGQPAFLPSFSLFDKEGGTHADDCIEGGVGSCWLIGALAAVAEVPGAMPRLFARQAGGGVAVRLFVDGAWRSYAIDEQLPACGGGGAPVVAAYAKPPASAAVWGCLLEKAYAASGGAKGYDTLNGGDPAAALLALSGSRCEELSVDAVGVGELEAWLADRLARPDVAVCCASRMFDSACQSDVVSRDGVHQNHCYSVLGCAAGADGATRFRLRNPWGRKGLARAGEGPVDAAGGCFWLGAAPLVNGFSTMYAATLTTPPPTGTSLRCFAATSPDGPAPMTHTERAGRWAALGRGASAAARSRLHGVQLDAPAAITLAALDRPARPTHGR
jgi:hypothetical protein